jgi:chromosome partitioning protein
MRIVALAQQKGGCGKSAASINLACQAQAAGEKAALIDLDAEQGTSRRWGKRRSGKDAPIVCEADALSVESVLQAMRADGVQWAFLDLPGRSHPQANIGFRLADFMLIPCRPLDVDIEASVDTVQRAKRGGRRYAYLMSICPSQMDRRRARQMASTLSALGHPVTPIIIVQRISVPDAIARGLGVNEAEPKGHSAKEFEELFQWLKAEINQ